MLGLSPYLVFAAREARPYPIVALLFLAGLLALERGVAGSRRALTAAALAFVLAAFFHPVVLPAACLAWLLAGRVALGRAAAVGARVGFLLASAVGAVVFVGLLGPALSSLLSNVGATASVGQPDWTTPARALGLLLGVGEPLAPWLWLAAGLVAIGVARVPARIAWIGVGGVAATTLPLLVARTEYLELPWVFLRYHAHLIPLVLWIAAEGAAGLLARVPGLPPSRRAVAAAVAMGLIAFGAAQGMLGRYPHLRGGTSLHPSLFALRPDDIRGGPFDATLDALADLSAESGAVLEIPFVSTLPLHRLTQLAHRRPVIAGSVAEGRGQSPFAAEGARFEWVMPVPRALPRVAAVVVHKRPRRELRAWFRHLATQPHLAPNLAPLAPLYDASGLAMHHPGNPLAGLPSLGPVLYEDAWIRIHDPDAGGR